VSFRYLLSKVILFVLSTLYIKQCLLILPLFVAICVIWLLGLTYGVYLVLSLKPGATKPLPSRLKYAFLNHDPETPVIISDMLSKAESYRLVTVLEKYGSIFGYSLQDLKGISPTLCTHHISRLNPIEGTSTMTKQHNT
jgi:hypothetical protein